MMKKISMLTVGASLVLSSVAASTHAALLYSTGFNSPTYSNGALVGQDAWSLTGTVVTNPIQVINTATDGSVALTTGQDANRVYSTAVSASDSSIYYSVNASLTTASTGGDYFMHLSDGGSTVFLGRLFAKSATGGYVLGLTTSSGTPTYGSTVLSFATEYQFVARYDVVSGLANDTGALYVDPISNTEGSNSLYVAATTLGTDATSIASFIAVNLRQGGTTSAPTVNVDDIRVATTFGEAAVVPEPASLGLIALGGLALLRRRRSTVA